jgi:hypothetical protein
VHTDMPFMKSAKEEEHVAMLLRRVRDANALGRIGKRDYWIRSYLNSNDAKLVAVRRANRQFKSDRRLKKAELRAIGERLNPWKGTDEPVLVHLKRKPSNPNYFRVFMDFGIENRALQYLVRRPLEILADTVPFQYTLKGGTKAAIEHVVKAMSEGPVWAIELDVKDCYPSFDGKKLPSLIPLPKEVTDHVIVSEYLHLVPGNIGYHFGPTGVDDPGLPWELEKTLVDARRGIPQGSAASPLVAESMLAIALRQIPDGVGHRVVVGDNCLVVAKEEGDVVQIVKALGGALEHHPAGRFWPKIKSFRPGETISFLGHSFTPQAGGKIRITPSPKNREKFEATVTAGLKQLQFSKLSQRDRKREYRDLQRYVRSWAAAFSLCEGIGDYRAHWMKKIAKVSPLAS